jgi:hypothetical protein
MEQDNTFNGDFETTIHHYLNCEESSADPFSGKSKLTWNGKLLLRLIQHNSSHPS